MTPAITSRREALKTFGAALAAGACNLACREATAQPPAADAVVDCHLHVASSRLSRPSSVAPPPPPFDLTLQPGGHERLAKLIEEQIRTGGVTHALCMPTAEISDQDPLGIQPSLTQAALVKGAKLYFIGVAHPERFDRNHLARVEELLKQGQVKAFKAYLGYLHYSPDNPGYRPYYRLAAKYNIPMIFHTGDTYSPVAKVRHAHPLIVDDLAVDFPETKFVLAHFGNPWVMDAAQVVYKNKNVFAELSAFLIGEETDFARMKREGFLERTAQRIRHAIEYTEAPDRFLFGSDWPLSPIGTYRDYVKTLMPPEHHAAVLSENAKKLYGL